MKFQLIPLLFTFLACNAQENTVATSHSPQEELIFQSGFEGGSKVIPVGNRHDIIGKDDSLSEKSDWVKDLEKNGGAGFRIEYTGGDDSRRYAAIIPEPGNPQNKVLQFWLNDSWMASENEEKARVQADFYGIKGGFKEFYQSVRVFLTDDFKEVRKYPKQISWLTISEFWNNEWWIASEKYGFRITLGIGKPAGENDLFFILKQRMLDKRRFGRQKITR